MAADTLPAVYHLPVSKPNWDRVGIFYVSWCATWTACLLSGMLFLWCQRELPILRIRGLPLAFVAVLMLHAYWILAQITYPVAATMPVVAAYSVQYFFMGIWFPLGIALFHASNLRFLHVARLQRQFAQPVPRGHERRSGASWVNRLRSMPYDTKVMVSIGAAMVLQVLLTTGMWIACRKYHPAFGIPGTGLTATTIPGQLVQLSRGWEWWPSVLWQFVWTWIVAPYLIWKAWAIRDTMGWRVQTVGCCLSNLHATPMFLIAQYVPAFAKVNRYFSPSQWIHLSIVMFEVFTVFVPVVQVIRLRMLRKKSVEVNAEWETTSQTSTLVWANPGDRKSYLGLDKDAVLDIMNEELGDRLLTMGALDHVLTENPAPLQEFSAHRDFSGENVAFLIRAAEWKAAVSPGMTEQESRDAFSRALWIYIDFISPRDAEFPLNLSSHDLRLLEEVFERPARIVCGEAVVNPATPFDVERPSTRGGGLQGRVRYTGVVPGEFGWGVFDRAQSHVKYLVLTNTWPKFVADMQSRRRSVEMSPSIFTHLSDATVVSRVSSKLARMVKSE